MAPKLTRPLTVFENLCVLKWVFLGFLFVGINAFGMEWEKSHEKPRKFTVPEGLILAAQYHQTAINHNAVHEKVKEQVLSIDSVLMAEARQILVGCVDLLDPAQGCIPWAKSAQKIIGTVQQKDQKPSNYLKIVRFLSQFDFPEKIVDEVIKAYKGELIDNIELLSLSDELDFCVK